MRTWVGIIKNRVKAFLFGAQKKIVAQDTYELDQKEFEKLEKALKCYLFCRQKSRKECPDEIQERLIHAGHIAFSLVATFLEEREFKMEYMEFLNDEIAAYCAMESQLSMLAIPPILIDEIDLKQPASFRFSDEESGKRYSLTLDRKNRMIQFEIEQAQSV